MGQKSLEHWVATENIARFEEQLKSEKDICQRKYLEGLLMLERERLRALSSLPTKTVGAAAEKSHEHGRAEKPQGDSSPQGH